MNLGQLRASTYFRAGIATTDGLITTAVVNDAINEALHAVSREEDWPWLQTVALITTVSGTEAYAFPASYSRTLDVRFDRTDTSAPEVTLYEQEPYELKERWALIANGQPREWSIYDDTVIFRPVPDGVYVIAHTYMRPEPDLVSDSDTPVMPADEHFALVNYAAYIVLRRDAEDPRAVSALNAYTSWLNRMRQQRRRVTKPWRIHVRQGYEL